VHANRRSRSTVMDLLILQIWCVCQGMALARQAGRYLRTDFTVEQGLPDDEVNAITQTPNGLLWVGTDGGLARFDGAHLTQTRLRTGFPKKFRKFSADCGRWGALGGHRFPKTGDSRVRAEMAE
jgi:ligand-binding sensor domain-containing protein